MLRFEFPERAALLGASELDTKDIEVFLAARKFDREADEQQKVGGPHS